MMRRPIRSLLLMALVVYCLLFALGDGCGAKTDDARINRLDTVFLAHRGGDGEFPENSLESIARAAALGYDGVEVDIQETRDGHFVLFHDDSCQRMLGLNGLACEKTLAELQSVPLMRHNVQTAGRVVVLDTVLARFGDRLLFYLDCKMSGLGQAERLASILARQPHPENILVASSFLPFLTWLEYRHPELHTVLEGFDSGEEWTYRFFPKNMRPDLLSSFSFTTDSAQVDWLREHDLLGRKLVYGVDKANYVRLRALGITRFIVDEGVGR